MPRARTFLRCFEYVPRAGGGVRKAIGTLMALVALGCLAAPAQAMSSAAAKKAVRKAVERRYDAPTSIAVRCRRQLCKVAFRRHASVCRDARVRVTAKGRVRALNPSCTADPAPGGSGETSAPPPATSSIPAPAQSGAPAQAPAGTPPTTAGPPPPPIGPPPPPAGRRGLAHTSSDSYEWWGWTNAYQWDAYPGYWFVDAVWHDLRNCEPYYADYHGVYFWDGSRWQSWYGYWKNWWFGDVYTTDPCSS